MPQSRKKAKGKARKAAKAQLQEEAAITIIHGWRICDDFMGPFRIRRNMNWSSFIMLGIHVHVWKNCLGRERRRPRL
jgi:hypothetical protein